MITKTADRLIDVVINFISKETGIDDAIIIGIFLILVATWAMVDSFRVRNKGGRDQVLFYCLVFLFAVPAGVYIMVKCRD